MLFFLKGELLKVKLSLHIRQKLGVPDNVISWRVWVGKAGAAAAFESTHPCNLILCFASTASKDVFAISRSLY